MINKDKKSILLISFFIIILSLLIALVFCPTISTDEYINMKQNQETSSKTVSSSTVANDNNKEEDIQIEYQFVDAIPLSKDLQVFTYNIAKDYNIPVGLIYAIMDVESDFDANAISETDDYGICQINKINHNMLKDELGLDDMLDPYQNIVACAYIYSNLLNENDGDINLAAMCYNCGSYGASNLWKQGIYSTEYSRKIVDTYNDKYKNI